MKTRLALKIGDQKAFSIYQKLLQKTDSVLNNLKQEVVVFYSGEPPTLFENIFKKYRKIAQQGEGMGARMSHAFQWGFDDGYEKIIIIGTDLWDLTTPLLQNAFMQLNINDYVIGPALDGGYYLLGCKRFNRNLFTKKNWSSSTVLEETLEELIGYSVALLDEKNDVDTYKNLLKIPELLYTIKKNEKID